MYPKTSNRVHISLDMHPKSQNWVHVIYTLLYNSYLEQSHNKQDNHPSSHTYCPAASVHFPPLPFGQWLFHWVWHGNAVTLHHGVHLRMVHVPGPLTPMGLCKIHCITFCSYEHAITKVHTIPPLHGVHPRLVQCVIFWHRYKLHRSATHQAKSCQEY